MKTEQPILITSITAIEDLSKNVFVDFFGSKSTGTDKSLGVCNADTSTGEQAPVVCRGIALVKTSAAISVGAQVLCNNGLASPTGVGPAEGYALDAASGAGELIRVLLV